VLSQRHSEPHGQDGTWPTASATADSAQSFSITCTATVDRQPAGQIVSIYADRQHRQPLRTVRGPRRCAAAELLYQPATVPSPDTTGRMERCQLPTSDTGMGRRRITFFRGRHHSGPILARGMVALSLPLPLRWAVAAGQEELVEVLPREDSGLTTTVAEVYRDMAAVSATTRRTSNQLSVTRKLCHVQALM